MDGGKLVVGELGTGELVDGKLVVGKLVIGELGQGGLGRRKLERGNSLGGVARRVTKPGPAARIAGVPRMGDSQRRPALSPKGGCRAPTRTRTFRATVLPVSADLRRGRREENGKAAMRVSLRSKVGTR